MTASLDTTAVVERQAAAASRVHRPYLVNVQILRFLAALLVVFGHATTEAVEIASGRGQLFAPFVPLDWGLGVDIFFIISGFIMYYLTVDQFAVKGAPFEFMKRRLIRIVPLYWICTTAYLAMLVISPGDVNGRPGLLDTLLSYVFIPWPRADGGLFPVYSLGWTLNYEMLFYVSLAVCLLLPRRIGLAALGVFLVSWVIIAPFAPKDLWFIQFLGNPIVPEFLIGIALSWLCLNGRAIKGSTAIMLIAAGIVLAVILYQANAYSYVWRLVTGGGPALLIAAAAILAAPVSRNAVTNALAFLGDASYSLYLTHPFAIKAVGILCNKLDLPLAFVFVLGVPAALAVGAAVHLVVERPLLRLLGSGRKAAA
jgi:peptidoglycan/LPS O-acetylase OafA/YrhL